MPVNIVDVDAFTATVQSQADGEAVNQTNELLSHQSLANRTRYLYNRNLPALGGSITIPFGGQYQVGADWGNDTVAAGGTGAIRQVGIVAALGSDFMSLSIPNMYGCRMASIHVSADAGVGRAGVPAVPVTYRLYRLRADGTLSTLSTVVDPEAGALPGYEAWHEFDIGLALVDFEADANYFLEIQAESLGNSQPGYLIYNMYLVVTPV